MRHVNGVITWFLLLFKALINLDQSQSLLITLWE